MQMHKKVSAILGKTKFAGGAFCAGQRCVAAWLTCVFIAPLVACAANPKSGAAIGLAQLVAKLAESAPLPRRNAVAKEQFLFSVDHCFSLKVRWGRRLCSVCAIICARSRAESGPRDCADGHGAARLRRRE